MSKSSIVGKWKFTQNWKGVIPYSFHLELNENGTVTSKREHFSVLMYFQKKEMKFL